MSDVHAERRAKLASTRTFYTVMSSTAILGALVGAIAASIAGAWFIAPFALLLGGVFGLFYWRIRSRFDALPLELIEHGLQAPGIVRSARYVGLALKAPAFGSWGVRRAEYRFEVQPPGRDAYEIVLLTFDGPPPDALAGRSVPVYIDPANPQRVCPDWSALA